MSILQPVAQCSPLTWSCATLTTPVETSAASRSGRLWVDPVRLLEVTHAPQLGQWALATVQRFSPHALPSPSRAGRPRVYTDLSVFLTSLVAAARGPGGGGRTAAPQRGQNLCPAASAAPQVLQNFICISGSP